VQTATKDKHHTQVIVLASAELYREAWRALLAAQPYIHVTQTACNAAVVPALLDPDFSTVVLIDLPGDELSAIRQLKLSSDAARALMVIDDYEIDVILPLLKAGATGCIARADSVADLARAIIAAGRGEIALPPTIAGRALAVLASGASMHTNPVKELTAREVDVVRLLASGMTNKDIAQTLFLSVRTIEAHLRSIYDKLAVSSRTEAALWAVRNGFAPPD
jgi:DNA-binding NarL/FixJ family response regulator